MFEGTSGSVALLHVGMRTYPDGGKHKDILRKGAPGEGEGLGVRPLDDEEITRLTALPAGLSRGNAVAILELGETRLADLEERETDKVQRAVCAYGGDMGRYLTYVKRSAWLEAPVKMKGRPGIWKAVVPRAAIPEGWDLPE